MKLHRILFYILIIISSISIITIIIVEPNSVWSRICSGLMTGSFIAAITAFVNYMHQREPFLDQLSSTLDNLAYKLNEYKIESRNYNKYIQNHTFPQIANYVHKHISYESESYGKISDEIEYFSHLLNIEAYCPLLLLHNKIRENFEKLNIFVTYRLHNIPKKRFYARVIVEIPNGESRDKAIIELRDENIIYFNLIVFYMKTLSDIISKISHTMTWSIKKSTIDSLDLTARFLDRLTDCYDIIDVEKNLMA